MTCGVYTSVPLVASVSTMRSKACAGGFGKKEPQSGNERAHWSKKLPASIREYVKPGVYGYLVQRQTAGPGDTGIESHTGGDTCMHKQPSSARGRKADYMLGAIGRASRKD